MKSLKIFSIILSLVFLMSASGCKQSTNEEVQEPTLSDEQEHIEKIVKEEPAEDAVEKIMAEMTLEEKVWQMMFVRPESITKMGVVTAAGDKTKEALENYPVGGILYFKVNLESREQVIDMISNSQSYSKIPLFISVDEEGGRVARIGSQENLGTKMQPAMGVIGATGDPENAYNAGKEIANDIKALGFNVDFAPVADVLVNKNNTEIGDRSFGSDPDLVSLMVESAVKGFQENDVSATLKHFPGQGSTGGYTDRNETELNRTIDELRKTELKPFKAGIDAGADFVMMSGSTSILTDEKLPCVLSEEVVQGILRDELGFEGIIITDTLEEGAIPKYKERMKEENPARRVDVYVMAIDAGVDMLLLPQDIDEAHKEIMLALKDGTLSEERINESVRRILTLKIEKGLWK